MTTWPIYLSCTDCMQIREIELLVRKRTYKDIVYKEVVYKCLTCKCEFYSPKMFDRNLNEIRKELKKEKQNGLD